MKNNIQFNLIDGSFNIEDAKDLLETLIMDKINFHNLKKFSNEERFGDTDILTDRRLKKLKDNQKEVLRFLNNLDTNENKIEIKSTVEISVKPSSAQ